MILQQNTFFFLQWRSNIEVFVHNTSALVVLVQKQFPQANQNKGVNEASISLYALRELSFKFENQLSAFDWSHFWIRICKSFVTNLFYRDFWLSGYLF